MLKNKQRNTKHLCKLIAELVGTDKRVLREMISRLEYASGAPGMDMRLSGEIYGALHMKMRGLGLDPNDTTPRELYQALLNLTAVHDKFLADRIGITNRNNPEKVLPAVVNVVNGLRLPKQAWAIKHVAAKRLLKAVPPKVLMKLLNYRSVDSLLKREPPAMLLAAARHTEPDTWQQRFVQSYKRLRPNDFEVRPVEVRYMADKRWRLVGAAFGGQKLATIIHAPEIAAIVVLPLAISHLDGLTLTSLLLIVHYINEIRAYSTFIKFHHMRRDFGKLLVSSLLTPSNEHARLAGQPIHWRVIHRYYGSGSKLNHPEIFEPHLQPEDLYYRKAEALLFRMEPALHFWHDLDYVGLPQAVGGPVSFNLTDMAMNLLNHIPYEKRANYHMRAALWNELYGRYAGQPALERQLLKQLDDQTISEPAVVPDMEFVW